MWNHLVNKQMYIYMTQNEERKKLKIKLNQKLFGTIFLSSALLLFDISFLFFFFILFSLSILILCSVNPNLPGGGHYGPPPSFF